MEMFESRQVLVAQFFPHWLTTDGFIIN